MKKRILSILTALCLCLTLLPTAALAANPLTLKIQSPSGLSGTVEIDEDKTVKDLKTAIGEKFSNITIGTGKDDSYRLFCAELSSSDDYGLTDDTKVLKNIGFANGHTVYLEKNSWTATADAPIHIMGLTITGGRTGAQESAGDWESADYYWNYSTRTIVLRSTKALTISGTGEGNVHIVVKSNNGWKDLTIKDLDLTTSGTACITLNTDAKLKLTLAGTNTLISNPETQNGNENKSPAIELCNSDSQLRIKGSGALTATSNCTGMPGIGTDSETVTVKPIEIQGGTITANGGDGAPGLMSSSIAMDGGKLTAVGGTGSEWDIYLYDTKTTSGRGIFKRGTPVIVAGRVKLNADFINVNEGSQMTSIVAPDVYFNTDTTAEVTGNAWYPLYTASTSNGSLQIEETSKKWFNSMYYGKAGGDIQFTATPDTGYIVDTANYNDMTATGSNGVYTFTMPASSVRVSVSFTATQYTIKYELSGGTASNPGGYNITSEDITLKEPTKAGYRFLGWSGTDLTGEDNLTVTIPAGSTGHRVYTAHWEKIDDLAWLLPVLAALDKEPFDDVKSGDWFYDDVQYAYDNGLMTGTGSRTFSPDAPVTRGMVMTILARCEGIKTDHYSPWYAAGVEWAVVNGISDGSNPEAAITREELATMLYRYAKLRGYDLSGTVLAGYSDANSVSTYATSAMQWAVNSGLINGAAGVNAGKLLPQSTATRAQLAAILHRFFG